MGSEVKKAMDKRRKLFRIFFDRSRKRWMPPKPTAKGSAAAKKAWATRRANAEDPAMAEAERLEALRILDELAKNRPPVTEE